MTLCNHFNKMADEITSAESDAGHVFYDRKAAVRALGRGHYAIWAENAHKQNLTLTKCLLVAFFYTMDLIGDALTTPLGIILCKRR